MGFLNCAGFGNVLNTTKLIFYLQLLLEKDKLGFSKTQRKKSVDKTSSLSQWQRVMETEKESDFQKKCILAEVFFFFFFTYAKN